MDGSAYQRAGDIWPYDKRALLIDSLLNGFDIPKPYLHDGYPEITVNGDAYRFAVIDGKQRLNAVWSFMDGEFRLPADSRLINRPEISIANLTYDDLAFQEPWLRAEFDSRPLDVVTVAVDDLELIEEMFSRLNEAVPLTAPERRNALRGPLPPVIRALAQHAFFTDCLLFSNRRYRHYDLACKFL